MLVMSANIVLPQTRGNDSSVKDLIISILGKEWPLSTRQIFNRIQKIYALSCSYQAVHKSIKKLLESSVIEKNGKEYQLNLAWLDELKNFSEDIQKEYNHNNKKLALKQVEEKTTVKYFDNYRERLLKILKLKVGGMPKLNCAKTNLGENGQRIKEGKVSPIVKKVSSESNIILLLGPSGSGKTTSLMQIAIKACKNNKVPILFNLTKYAGQDISEIVQQAIFEVSGERINTAFIEEALSKDIFMLLLDGLNEVTGSIESKQGKVDKTEYIIEKINSGNFNNNKNKLVVACRTNADPKNSIHAIALQLQPFDEKQIQKYLTKRDLQTLFMEIKKDTNLFELCQNPLMLDLTVNIYKSNKLLPENKTKLYQEYFTSLFYGWESKNLNRSELIALDLEETLSKLAYETINQGTHFSTETFLRNMRKNCQKLGLDKKTEKKIIDAIIKTNMIQIEGSNCSFRHHSFQEFFAAKDLQSQFEKSYNKKTMKEISTSKSFLEPLKFLSGLIPDSTKLINELQKHNLFFAGECAITANKINQTVFERTVKKLIRTVGAKDLTKVWYAVDIINRMGTKATPLVKYEIEKGKDSDLKRRMYWVAGGISDQDLNNYLVSKVSQELDEHNIVHFLLGLQESASKERAFAAKNFLTHKNPIVQGDALLVLKNHALLTSTLLEKNNVKQEKLENKLAQTIKSKEFWKRMHSILILGKLKYQPITNELVNLLDDKDSSIQWYATLALCQIGNQETLPLINQKIKEENKKVYHKAKEAFQNGVKDRKTLAKIWSF